MTGCMNRHATTATQIVVIFQPFIGFRRWCVIKTELGALIFQCIPKKLVALVQKQWRTSAFLNHC